MDADTIRIKRCGLEILESLYKYNVISHILYHDILEENDGYIKVFIQKKYKTHSVTQTINMNDVSEVIPPPGWPND